MVDGKPTLLIHTSSKWDSKPMIKDVLGRANPGLVVCDQPLVEEVTRSCLIQTAYLCPLYDMSSDNGNSAREYHYKMLLHAIPIDFVILFVSSAFSQHTFELQNKAVSEGWDRRTRIIKAEDYR